MNLFENELSVGEQNLEVLLHGYQEMPWSDHLLNRAHLCGGDFLARWSQDVWNKRRLVAAINSSSEFFALPYGPNSVAPDDDPRDFELYFERLETAHTNGLKRPDLLILRKANEESVLELVESLGGLKQIPFTTEGALTEVIHSAVLAIECENSLRVAADYGREIARQRKKQGVLGLRKNAALPTMILKQENIESLQVWQDRNNIPIHIWHVFFDLAFGISLDRALQLIQEGTVEATQQTFQAPSGKTTTKKIYNVYCHYSYILGESKSKPTLKAAYVQDKNGHILPYVKFQGGELLFQESALDVVRDAVAKRL